MGLGLGDGLIAPGMNEELRNQWVNRGPANGPGRPYHRDRMRVN
jgi:hypothetical protein